MKTEANTVEEYIDSLPEDRKTAIIKFRKAILENIPKGFVETISYGMIGYVIPHSIFPAGYRTDPKLPLPFINLASQKNYIALYHMGIYGDQKLTEWFVNEYFKVCKRKPDMGKGCIRFKNMDQIPYTLIGELAGKITVEQRIIAYESYYKTETAEQKK
jgi:uncharacterized protein YdhG (YjbR/CyaY superfamily)